MKLKTFVIQGALVSGLCFGAKHLAQNSMIDSRAAHRIDSFERAAENIESRIADVRSCKRELELARTSSTSEHVRCIDHKRAIGEIRRLLRSSSEIQIRREVTELPNFAQTAEQVDQITATLDNMKWEYRSQAQKISDELGSTDKRLIKIRNLADFLAKISAIITAFAAIFLIKDKEKTDEKSA